MGSKDRAQLMNWGKNLLIFLLTLSALYLMGRSNLGASLAEVLWKETGSDAAPSQNQENQRVWPVRMALQNQRGRYGIQYDQDGVETLFSSQLGNLLGELLGVTQGAYEVPESLWRGILLSGQPWVYYDFLGSIPLSRLPGWLGDEGGNLSLTGQVRAFLLTEEEGGKALYYYNQDRGSYYRCVTEQTLTESAGRLSSAVAQYLPNDMIFAMEDTASYGQLWAYTMILPTDPVLPAYEASNPLGDLGEEERDQLLQDLSFLPKAVSQYRATDGLVIREGGDTLRLLDSGDIRFTAHAGENPQARFPLESWPTSQVMDQALEESKRILDAVLSGRTGEAYSYCIGGEELADGGMRVTYGYLLSGAQVHVGNTGWAAEFIFREGRLESFTIRLRRYEDVQTLVAVLPVRLALAALSAMDQMDGELLLCYNDNGDGTMGVGWIAR